MKIDLNCFKKEDHAAMIQGMELIVHLLSGTVMNVRHQATRLEGEDNRTLIIKRDADKMNEVFLAIGELSKTVKP
jgi:hypothetical protein